MNRKRELQLPIKAIDEFCKRWQVKEFSFFGSILREDFNPQSDIDILLSFSENAQWGLFEFVEMKDELKEILGREVDIVEKEGLRNPFRKREILETRKVVYAA
jgi:predicted nucleotidyltransferase